MGLNDPQLFLRDDRRAVVLIWEPALSSFVNLAGMPV